MPRAKTIERLAGELQELLQELGPLEVIRQEEGLTPTSNRVNSINLVFTNARINGLRLAMQRAGLLSEHQILQGTIDYLKESIAAKAKEVRDLKKDSQSSSTESES